MGSFSGCSSIELQIKEHDGVSDHQRHCRLGLFLWKRCAVGASPASVSLRRGNRPTDQEVWTVRMLNSRNQR
eukprot:1351502-Rhodomonas_salina.3